MKLERIKLETLKPLEHNVRLHSERQVKELIRSVQQFGQTRALVVDENNNILIGNGLYKALKEMGEDSADCHVIAGLTETQKKKLILADNKIFSLGTDDFDAIKDYIGDIASVGDYDIAGFDTDILKSMTQSFSETVNDMSNYGVIKNDALSVQGAQNAPQTKELPQPIGNTTANNNVSPEVSTTPTIVPEKTMRSVICPNCGEVIYLD